MTLKKPSDIFNKKDISGVFKSPEISPNISESYDRFRGNFDKVNILSEKVEQLSQQLTEKLDKTDLENAMLSQLMVLDENFKSLQNQVKGLNKEDLKEFKSIVFKLNETVEDLIQEELPKYKKQVTKSEVRISEKFDTLKEVVEENIVDIRGEVDTQVNNIAEVIDNNLEYFNNQLQETSSKVKDTTDTYNKLSKILENKVSQENEKLEEYSQIIQSLQEAFVELQSLLEEKTSSYDQVIQEKFETISSSIDDRIENIDEEVDNFKNKVSSDISNIKTDVVINEQHLKKVDNYLKENHKELIELKEEVFGEIGKLSVGNLQENLERLEKKIDYIKETYSKIEPEVIVKEVIREGLLNEPPNTKNSDPLTPLDQKFVTLDQLQEHYRLFINRIQQQLSTIGGGGETKLRYLDDIVGISTNASAYDGKFLKYDHSIGKFEFVTVSGGSGGIATYATNAGIATYATYAGIATYATSAGIATYATNAGIATYATNAGISTYATNSGIATYATNAGIATYATSAGIATYATNAGIATSVIGGIGSITQLQVSGIITANSYFGSGTNITGIVTSIIAGIGMTVTSSTGQVTVSSSDPVLQNPIFTYTAGVLTSILYSSGATKTFTYTTGILTQIDLVVGSRTYRKTFNYTAGILTSITETEF